MPALATALLVLIPVVAESRNFASNPAWHDLGPRSASIAANAELGPKPLRFRAYSIVLDDVRAELARTHLDASNRLAAVEIALPTPEGRFDRYRATESPVLGPQMRDMLPDVRTYAARGIDDPTAYARIDVTRLGLRAYALTSQGTYAIDPLVRGRTDQVMSHWSHDAADLDAPFDCEVISTPGALALQTASARTALHAPAGDTLRTYRFTLTTGGEYTEFLGGDTLVSLAEMVTVVNRVNGAYERDLAVHLDAVWMKAYPNQFTDPFPDGNSVTDLSNFNQILVDSLVGPANYDVGVVLNQAGILGHSGVGGYPTLCETGFNSSTVITAANPLDLTTYRIVMHEMGHNFFSLHDWDAPCNRQVAYEPGSGSTIMGRAGRCGQYNIQAECDHYFSGFSMQEIVTFLRSRPGCGVATPTGNSPPTANAGPDYTIPRATPFILTGGGSDPDAADTLSFCWEQMDAGPAPFDIVLGALVRSRLPAPTPVRYYPLLENVLTNVMDPWDKLAIVDRIMTMRLTVRGASVGFGGHDWDEMVITVAGAPFQVTFPNGGEVHDASVPLNVTWNVGGSAALSPMVNILLSRDGGHTWAPLALGTPNDGTQSVALTGPSDTACRIKLESVGNIFYDVSNANFEIDATTSTQLSLVSLDARPDRVRLVWHDADPASASATVYRRAEQVEWVALSRESFVAGVLEFEDRTVEAGGRYGYRLGIRDGDAESFSPEVSVQVPARPRLELQGAVPNPARDQLRIAFALESSQAATLDVLDLGGRRVLSRDVGSLGPGTHLLDLSAAGRLSPGVYWLRLSQGDATRRAKVVVSDR